MTVVMMFLVVYAAGWCALAVMSRLEGDVSVATPQGAHTLESEPKSMQSAA